MDGSLKLTAIFLSLLPSTLTWAVDREKSVQNNAGEVVSVQGTAMVRQEINQNHAEDLTHLHEGSNVYAGDVINTSGDGSVKILMKDKTILDVGPSSLFKIAQFVAKNGPDRRVELDMKFGKMRLGVTKKLNEKGSFKIKTRAATMGVRGTELIISSPLELPAPGKKPDSPKAEITVLQGKVDVSNMGASHSSAPIHLSSGDQLSTKPSAGSPTTVKLSEVQMTTASSNSRVAENTFSKAVTIETGSDTRGPASTNSSGNNSSTGSSSGSTAGSTPAAAAAAMANPAIASITTSVPTVSIPFSEINVPGAPSVVNNPSPINQNNRSYHVTVTVSQ